jgi:BirA family biotin operon repressor/biotin-[acetyl-CoA-carboxylase] ligase
MNEEGMLARCWEGRTAAEWEACWGAPLVVLYERTGSTNDVARRLAEGGAPAGTVVIAEEQSAGRGRGGKRWHAPTGSALLLSIVLRPRAPLGAGSAPGTIPLRVGLAAARALDRATGTRLALKWPNDLRVEGEGKVAGILCEGALGTRDGGYVIAGIGLNVAQRREDFPADLAQPATSLLLAAGWQGGRAPLVGAILAEIAALEADLAAPLERAALDELNERDPFRGRPITVDGAYAGTACGIAPDGALLVRDADGQLIHLRNGTVRLAPPALRSTTHGS